MRLKSYKYIKRLTILKETVQISCHADTNAGTNAFTKGIWTKIFYDILSITTLWTNSADDKLMIFFLFFPEKSMWHFMQTVFIGDNLHEFVCVEVLRPSQPNGVMSSAVSLPNHTFTGQA